jgi:hypothetical protein
MGRGGVPRRREPLHRGGCLLRPAARVMFATRGTSGGASLERIKGVGPPMHCNACFPANTPEGLECLQSNHPFLAQVVQCLAWLVCVMMQTVRRFRECGRSSIPGHQVHSTKECTSASAGQCLFPSSSLSALLKGWFHRGLPCRSESFH